MNNQQQAFLEALGRVLKRLQDGIAQPNADHDDLAIDGVMQRFEFTFELFWKVLKKILLSELVETTTPRDVLRKAYRYKIIDDEQAWIGMIQDRNLSSDIYCEETAREILMNIKQSYLRVLTKTYENLAKKLQSKS
jgi:nucleotidyltransferase substrate binding protein (TIGR01987 family)